MGLDVWCGLCTSGTILYSISAPVAQLDRAADF